MNLARSSFYYRARARIPTIDDVLAQRIKKLIEDEPYLGYRMVWARLRMQGHTVNRKAVQRLMQLKGWQCHRRLKKRCRPRVEASTSAAQVSNVRWATDATYVWTRFDGLVYVNAVLGCGDRERIGLNVSQRNDAREAAWALEDALIRAPRHGVPGDAPGRESGWLLASAVESMPAYRCARLDHGAPCPRSFAGGSTGCFARAGAHAARAGLPAKITPGDYEGSKDGAGPAL